MKNKLQTKTISVFALTLLITGSIDSIRNLPTVALFGSSLIFFFVASAIVFLIPVALVSAELSANWVEHGGVYNWVKLAFGERLAFVAIWLQWINTVVWYPTILSFIAGTAAYLVNPALAQNKVYLVSIILSVFWVMTLVNLKGLRVSANFASFCAIIGMIIPMVLVVSLGAVWVFSGKPLQLHLSVHHLLPSFHQSQSWISLTAIMTAFLGMELATVHVKDIHHPKKNFPKALFVSVILILATMIFGSLTIAFVLPKSQINLVDGIMLAFNNFFYAYHMHWILPIIPIMIVVGSVGGLINWIISPTKGLFQAAQNGYLPKYFAKENKHGVPQRLLITQAILVSLVCMAFLLMPSVNGSYWLLTDLSTQLYMIMYALIFCTALFLRYKFPKQNKSFEVPGGKLGIWFVSLLGLGGCGITLLVGFFPPANINVGGSLHYELFFVGGMLLMLLPALLISVGKGCFVLIKNLNGVTSTP